MAPVGAGLVRVSVQNPGGLILSLQSRTGSGPFDAGQPVPFGQAPAVDAPADTLLTTCFRVVPDGSCPGYGPSAEVCYAPPPPPNSRSYPVILYLPDAFTPNSDGLNDTLKPIGESPTGLYRLTIVDRWGRVAFSSSGLGRYGGRHTAGGWRLYLPARNKSIGGRNPSTDRTTATGSLTGFIG